MPDKRVRYLTLEPKGRSVSTQAFPWTFKNQKAVSTR